MPGAPETKTALIVVRTYPTPAKKGVEVSCTAAISDRGEWLRLFPVPYRRLKSSQRFHKYQWIDIEVEKSSDARPESFRISRQDTISITSPVLSTADGWQARKNIVAPLMSPSMCDLRRQRDEHQHPTLGIFVAPLMSPSMCKTVLWFCKDLRPALCLARLSRVLFHVCQRGPARRTGQDRDASGDIQAGPNRPAHHRARSR